MDVIHYSSSLCIVVDVSCNPKESQWICGICFYKYPAEDTFKEHFIKDHSKENMKLNTEINIKTVSASPDFTPVKVSKQLRFLNIPESTIRSEDATSSCLDQKTVGISESFAGNSEIIGDFCDGSLLSMTSFETSSGCADDDSLKGSQGYQKANLVMAQESAIPSDFGNNTLEEYSLKQNIDQYEVNLKQKRTKSNQINRAFSERPINLSKSDKRTSTVPSCQNDGHSNKSVSGRFECSECGSDRFRSHKSFHTHLQSHVLTLRRSFTCHLCKKVFNPKVDLENSHDSPATKPFSSKSISSSKCKPAKAEAEIKQNIDETKVKSVSTEKQRYQCKQCTYTSPRHMNYHRHLLRHQSVMDHIQCDICRQKLNKWLDRSLEDIKPVDGLLGYLCRLCGHHSSRHAEHHRHLCDEHDNSECNHCNKTTKSQQLPPTEYICEKCGAKFPRHYGYHRHMITHLNIKESIVCRFCQKMLTAETAQTKDSSSLESQVKKGKTSTVIKTVHKGYECCQCGFRCTQKSVFQKHLKSHHLSPGFQCQVCGDFSADTPQGIKLHIRHSHGIYPKTCDFCPDAIYCDISELMEHLKHMHNICQFDCLCGECGRLYQHQTSFIKHRLSHLNDKITQDECVSPAGTQQLKSHESEKHKCKLCAKEFSSLQNLQHHLKRDHQIKPKYQCDKCNLAFSRKWNLVRHKTLQHEAQSQSCHLCQYSSKSVFLLYKHYTKSHLVEPPAHVKSAVRSMKPRRKYKQRVPRVKSKVMCEVCGQVITKGMLKIHMNRHSGVRPFKCHHVGCSYATVASNSLASHVKRRHLGISKNTKKLHMCSLCQYKTREKSRFLSHMRTKHENELSFASALQLNPGAMDLPGISEASGLQSMSFLDSVQNDSMDCMSGDSVSALLVEGALTNDSLVNSDNCNSGSYTEPITGSGDGAASLTEGIDWTSPSSSSFAYLPDVIQE